MLIQFNPCLSEKWRPHPLLRKVEPVDGDLKGYLRKERHLLKTKVAIRDLISLQKSVRWTPDEGGNARAHTNEKLYDGDTLHDHVHQIARDDVLAADRQREGPQFATGTPKTALDATVLCPGHRFQKSLSKPKLLFLLFHPQLLRQSSLRSSRKYRAVDPTKKWYRSARVPMERFTKLETRTDSVW